MGSGCPVWPWQGVCAADVHAAACCSVPEAAAALRVGLCATSKGRADARLCLQYVEQHTLPPSPLGLPWYTSDEEELLCGPKPLGGPPTPTAGSLQQVSDSSAALFH